MGRALVIMLVCVAACGDDGRGAPDATPPPDAFAPATATCADLAARFRALVGPLDTSCDTPEDCAIVGGIDCADPPAYLASRCEGDPVNAAAYAGIAGDIAPIAEQWVARCEYACDSTECAYECAAGAITCTNRVCGFEVRDCLPPP